MVCVFALQAVSTTLHLNLDSITGLPRSVVAPDTSTARGSTGSTATTSKVALVLIDTTTQ